MAEAIVALDEQSAVSVMCSVLESRPDLAPSIVNFAVPDLTYTPVKALSERRSNGLIKSYNHEKGFGFIACQELSDVFGNDVFLHHGQLSCFDVGAEVSFAVALNKDNKPQGYDLRPAGGGKGGGKAFSPQAAPSFPSGKGAPSKGHFEKGFEKGYSSKGGGFEKGYSAPAPQWSPADAGKGKGKDFGKGKDKGFEQSFSSSAGQKRKLEGGDDFKVDKDKELGSFSGFIKSFNSNKGYGFINCEDLQAMGYKNDVFLHHAQLGSHEVGGTVQFTAFLNGKNQPQAKDLQA